MILFPAIDLYEGKAVRLFKGEYSKMTVYGENPPLFSLDFVKCGAKAIHIVDLEGAKTGETPNFDVVCKIKETSRLFCEIGGGIRSEKTIERYINAGIDRVILGTIAVENEDFLQKMINRFGEKIAVGVDIKDGFVAVKGWTEKSSYTAFDFCEKAEKMGVKTIICTDISKDGVLRGPNLELYGELQRKFNMNFTASGGVTSIEDVKKLSALGLYGAIIGKAYYTGDVDLAEAVRVTL